MKSQEGVPVALASAAMPLAGTSGVLSELFREHHRRILIAAYQITGNMADAEDVTQSVFLRLANGTGLPPINAGSYLYRAAINRALDLLRRRKSAALEPLELVASAASTQAGSAPNVDLADMELRKWLWL